MEARRLVVTGYVQGIGYRYAMARAAQGFGVTGWVRNRNDGSVEAMVCGNAEQLAAIIAWARRGPSGAEVAQVAVEPGDDDYSGFEQRPTV